MARLEKPPPGVGKSGCTKNDEAIRPNGAIPTKTVRKNRWNHPATQKPAPPGPSLPAAEPPVKGGHGVRVGPRPIDAQKRHRPITTDSLLTALTGKRPSAYSAL